MTIIYSMEYKHGTSKDTGKDTDYDGDVNSDVNGDVNTLSGIFKEVYLIVFNNPGIKIGQVAEMRGKSESTMWKQLNALRKMNMIEYRGSDKTGGYFAK